MATPRRITIAFFALLVSGIEVILSWHALRANIAAHLRFDRSALEDPSSYNALQRVSYVATVFVLFRLVIWTGLAMAPAFTAVFPWTVNVLGGRQSARTLHFFVTTALWSLSPSFTWR